MIDFHPSTFDVGLISMFLTPADPRPAREQFHERYAHGGGWHPVAGWSYNPQDDTITYHVPIEEGGDEVFQPGAIGILREEKIIVYPHAWVCIAQKDGSFEVSWMN